MSDSGQEIEAKFYVRDLERIRKSLDSLGAHVIQPRVLEMNLRFDLPDGSLRKDGRVLRLRRDSEAKLTYKGGGKNNEGILSREEIEFVVEDFEKAQRFLEALGYQKQLYYEKYRTTYEWENTFVMLDEMPFGNFVEIEGEGLESIREVAAKLNLDMGRTIPTSYTALFERARTTLNFSFQDLSFANFATIHVDPFHLQVSPGDE